MERLALGAYFAECNGWTYTLHVQHDIEGLAELMGGTLNFRRTSEGHAAEIELFFNVGE